MDRMDMAAKTRLAFIKLLHKNNEEKARMICSFNDEKLGRTSDKGLREASDLLDKIKGDHAQMNSIPRRLKIINDFCVNIEMQVRCSSSARSPLFRRVSRWIKSISHLQHQNAIFHWR
jgi:hypothetical protein